MSKTYAIASIKFIDVTARSDSAVSSVGNQDIANLSLLKEDSNPSTADYGTSELNQFVLDGSKAIMPDSPTDIAFMSGSKSNESCLFTTNPSITITFTAQHSSAGITLHFVDDYPAKVKVTWYSLDGISLSTETYEPDDLEYFCDNQISNYGGLKIEFVQTNFPYEYIKMSYIDYGVQLSWEKDSIKKASIVEEVDVTSSTISINTGSISILDEKNRFDIANNTGLWKSVQKTQEVTLIENKDGIEIPCGTFFIDEMSFKDNIATFALIDAVGLLDKYKYYNGEIYSNASVGPILQDIFETAGISKYDIADEIAEATITGWIGICTCREAIQQICFAIGALVDDSRSDTISIYYPNRYTSATIGTDRKFNGSSKVELDSYVSGVSIAFNKYSLDSESSEIYNDTLPAGTNRIEFSEPYAPSTITCSGGTITEVKTNYMIVSMASEGACTIEGKKYSASSFAYSKNTDTIEGGETENVKEFGTCTVYSPSLISTVVDSLFSYYALRKIVSVKYLLEAEYSGNWVNIRDKNNVMSTTLIESQSIDLTGGFIATSSCRGYSKVVTEYYYTGELYAGERGVL